MSEKNKTVEISVAEIQARLTLTENANKELQATVDELTSKLKDANDLIEGDTKSKLIADVERVTDFKLSELVGMDADRLRQIRDDHARYKSKKFVSGADKADAEGDVYAPLKIYGKYKR